MPASGRTVKDTSGTEVEQVIGSHQPSDTPSTSSRRVSKRLDKACVRCQRRKIKCDPAADGCAPCKKAKEPCKDIIPNSDRVVIRGETRQLQHDLKLQGLDSEVARALLDEYQSRHDRLDRLQQQGQAGYMHLKRIKLRTPSPVNDLPQGATYYGIKLLDTNGQVQLSTIEGSRMTLFDRQFSLDAHFPSRHSEHSKVFDVTEEEYFEHRVGSNPGSWPSLPERQEAEVLAVQFFTQTALFTPIVHQPDFLELLDKAQEASDELSISEMVIVQMVFAVHQYQCAIRGGEVVTELGQQAKRRLLWSLQHFRALIRDPSLQAFQALTLICMAMRALQRPGAAWHCIDDVMMYAIRNKFHTILRGEEDEDEHLLVPYERAGPLGEQHLRIRVSQLDLDEQELDESSPRGIVDQVFLTTSLQHESEAMESALSEHPIMHSTAHLPDPLSPCEDTKDGQPLMQSLQSIVEERARAGELSPPFEEPVVPRLRPTLSRLDEERQHHQMRARVFWSLLVFHVHLCCNLGRPFRIDPDEINIGIPQPTPDMFDPADGETEICAWRHAPHGFRMCHIMLKTYTESNRSLSGPRRFSDVSGHLLTVLEKIKSELLMQDRMSPGTATDFVTMVAHEYLKLAIHGTRLYIRHMQFACTNDRELSEDQLDALMAESRQILHVAQTLHIYQSIDTTVYYNMYFVYAFFMSLWVEAYRAERGRAQDKEALRLNREEWLLTMRNVSRYMGLGKELSSELSGVVAHCRRRHDSTSESPRLGKLACRPPSSRSRRPSNEPSGSVIEAS